jgi:DNA polymerase I-like protein with 3'-5' exonuclease and polymerase domains
MAKLTSMLSTIEEYRYLAFDCETTGLNVRKDTVIGYSIAGKSGESFYVVQKTWDSSKGKLVDIIPLKEFKESIEIIAKKDLMTWNGSYDVRIVKNNFGIDLTESLLADVMLMKHTVEEDGDFGLKKVAIQYQEQIGLNVEEDANKEQLELKANVAKNGGTTTRANYEMYKADLDVMGKYACADADLTLRLAYLFREKLEKEGLEEFFYDIEVMPLYKEVTIKMEEKGIALDIPLMEETKKSIIKDIELLEDEVIESVMSTQAAKTWLVDKAAISFPVKTGGLFGQVVASFNNLPLPKTPTGKLKLGKKELEKLPKCHAVKFLLGEGELEDFEIKEIQKFLYLEKNGDPINISSKTQMGDLVFNYMGIKPLSKTDGGKGQFNDPMIQHLESKGFDWAEKLSNYNKLIKIKGTYIDGYLNAAEGGIFYPSFFQHRTVSGRYGSNVQQLPRPKEEGELHPVVLKYNNLIRKFFISGTDRKFIDSDVNSLEPNVFAHVSGDEGLKDIFRNGHDFYSTIAIRTEGLSGVSADKKAENYLGGLDKPKRQAAKAYSLGIPYGLGAYALSMTLEVSQEKAQKLIDGYLNGFPKLKEWMQRSEYDAKNKGYVKSEVGRIRHLPRVKELYEKHGNRLMDFKYRAKLVSSLGKEEVSKMYKQYKNGLNNSKNFQIQSLSASIVNQAAIKINRDLIRLGIDGWVALQIHDQLVINCPEERAEECRSLVEHWMENSYKISLQLKSPAEIAEDLYDGH